MTTWNAPQQLTYNAEGRLVPADGSPLLIFKSETVTRWHLATALGEERLLQMESEAAGEAADLDMVVAQIADNTEWSVSYIGGKNPLWYRMGYWVAEETVSAPEIAPAVASQAPFSIRAFRGFDSHRIIILNETMLPAEVARAFRRAAEARQIEVPLGFAQDAIELRFDPGIAPPPPPLSDEPIRDLFRKCGDCGRKGLMTTAPHLGICDDCA